MSKQHVRSAVVACCGLLTIAGFWGWGQTSRTVGVGPCSRVAARQDAADCNAAYRQARVFAGLQLPPGAVQLSGEPRGAKAVLQSTLVSDVGHGGTVAIVWYRVPGTPAEFFSLIRKQHQDARVLGGRDVTAGPPDARIAAAPFVAIDPPPSGRFSSEIDFNAIQLPDGQTDVLIQSRLRASCSLPGDQGPTPTCLTGFY